MTRALIIGDAQKDFCEGGSLAVTGIDVVGIATDHSLGGRQNGLGLSGRECKMSGGGGHTK